MNPWGGGAAGGGGETEMGPDRVVRTTRLSLFYFFKT